MTVDFAFKKTPSYRVASIVWKGKWSDASVHAHFLQVQKWAAGQKLKTGKWFFREPDEHTFETAIEIRGRGRGGGGVRLKTYPAATVVSVEFDPDAISPRIVYHGIYDFLRWRKKDHEIRSVGAYREVYDGDPWKDARAFARTTVQVVVRK